ncbi:COR domain-containing protein [Bacteroides graminisolvens]|uniref:leucine-rich repeat domain-containing protein n=1 Tax=Bacteroides graminisolvens TaxID=477666 RepID=UPI0023EF5B0B|nr:COR domain-containing protein [Bacteroides graminisolvens]
MNSFTNGDVFSSSCNMILVPISTIGTISRTFNKGLKSNNIGFNLTKQSYSLGDVEVQIVESHPTLRCIAYVCTVENHYSSYAAIRLIGKKIRKYADDENIQSIASPVLGTGAGRLDYIKSHNIFINSFYEKVDSSILLDVYVYDEDIFRNLDGANFDTDSSSGKLVIEAELPRILENDTIRELIHEREYYYEYAEDKFQEYLHFELNKKFYTNLLKRFKSSGLTFSNFLADFQGTEAEQHFFILCGQLVAYIDFNASFKNKWNEYPDKRVIARAGVRQTDWIINLIKFKEEGGDVKNITAKSIRNAFEYLLEPRQNLTMLSENHRKMVFENILSKEYKGKESLSTLFGFFKELGVSCSNPRNLGALYSRILYLTYIKLIWIENALDTTNTSEDISIASNLIFENLKNKSKYLDLGCCGIKDVSMLPELFECVHLEELILSNEWGEYEEGKWRHRTSKNSGNKNAINYLPAEIGKLKNLKKLVCGGDWNDSKAPFNEDYTFRGAWSIKSLSAVTGLEQLEYLNLSNNSIDSLKGISSLKNLKIVHLNNNQISRIDIISKLVNLEEIYLSNNKIKHVSPFKKLFELNTIDLHANKVRDISALEELIAKLGIKNSKWEVGTINIAKNPLEKPPIEIITTGKDAVLQYIKDIQTSKTYINKDVKVILVGNSEVGKTTLAKYFDDEKDLDKPHAATHWMEEREIKSKNIIEVIHEECVIHLFDFGGHDYFHDTHHLFYGTNTIYLLLWDKETNKLALRDCVQENQKGEEVYIQTQDYPIKYWLESVKHFIKDVKAENFEFGVSREETYNSSLLLIQNKVEKPNQIVHLNNKEIVEKYPFIYDFINVSITEKRNLAHLDSLMTEMLSKSSIIGAVLPRFYNIIKDGIKAYKEKPVLSMDEFQKYCNYLLKDKIETKQCEFLVDYLTKIGLILWFPDGGYKDKIYINKKWVIETIHNVLDGLVDKKGEFDISHVISCVEGDDSTKKAEDIIDIMKDFKLIFEHPYSKKYIAPLYLPSMPVNTINLFLSKKDIPYRRFEYSGFIHKHVILSFFKEYGTLILGDKEINAYYYWKDGLIIKDIDSESIVMIKFDIGKNDGNAFIDIFNVGNNNGKSFINSIIQYIKEINKGYEIEEMVTLDGKDFISLEVLTINAQNGKLVFTEQRISDKSKPPTEKQKYFKLKNYSMFLNNEIKKKKVVISYSKKDLEHVHTLRRYLQPLVDNELIEQPWYCTNLRASEEWDASIKEKFENADIVFFMVSEHFYATKYIVDNEIKNAIDRYNNDKSVKIVPIILEFYDWERKEPYNLQRFTALPYQAKPISDFNNPKMAWYTIAESVRMMIEKDLDPGKEDSISRELQEIYERQVKGKLDNNSL